MTDRYFFVHCMKTAGTSLFFQLRNQIFDKEQVYPTEHELGVPEATFDVGFLQEKVQKSYDNIQLISGHFPFCTMEILGGGFKSFTVVREPLARTLSYLRHHRKLTPSDQDKTLEEIYSDPFRFEAQIQNHMVKMFSLTPEIGKNSMLVKVDFTPDHLERAKTNLQSVDVIGCQENYAEFCQNLSQTFGWQFKRMIRGNVSEDTEGVSEAFKNRILKDNALDVEFYNFALELIERRNS